MHAQLIRTYRAHKRQITALAVPNEGQIFLSAAEGGSLRVGNLTSDEALSTMAYHADAIQLVPFPDGNFVAAGHTDGTIHFWNAETGEIVRRIEAHEGIVTALALSADGQFMISGSEDRTLAIWNTITGALLSRSPRQRDPIQGLALSPNADYVISGETSDNGSRLRVWQMGNGDHIRDFEDTYHGLTTIAFDDTGQRVISSSSDGEILIWNPQTGRVDQRIEMHVGITSISLSPNKRYALIGTHKPRLLLWSLETGQQVYAFDAPSNWVSQTAFSPDSRYVIAGCRDGMINVYHLTV